MKYIEVTRMNANSILKCGGSISIAIYRGIYAQDCLKEEIIKGEASLDDAETRIIAELPDNLHYTFKYFEVWAGENE